MAALCVLAYARSIGLPFISDDYVQIKLGREYGPVAGWADLADDALYRCRATSLVLTYWTEKLFGLNPAAFNFSSLLLHIVNTWLVFALGFWKRIGWGVSAVAACFFAIHQGHQEAVVWYAALPELLVFAFVLASLLCWLRWLEHRGAGVWAASLLFFGLALLSKESAVCAVGLMALTIAIERDRWRLSLLAAAPFAMLAVIYFALAHAARESHLHFNDGTFSLSAPFWFVVPRSIGRMLWITGALGLCALATVRRSWPVAGIAFAWMAVTLLPYGFLTYQPFVPSRHSYLASAGLALIVGAGFLAFRERVPSRTLAAAIVAAVVAANCAYLWTRKHGQYELRAQPTERLLGFAEGREGEIHIKCFPYARQVAEHALEVRFGGAAPRVHLDAKPDGADSLDLCDVRF